MRIYVGNLPYSTTEDELREIFAEFSEPVSTEVIKDKFSGQSKGFGFVEIADDSDANEAIKELNEKPFKGRNLKINEARPRVPRSGGNGDGYR